MNNITFVNGDIFDSECQTLVCPVNCVGVMGKGLALEFKKRFPCVYREYKQLCDTNSMYLGQMCIITTLEGAVALFPTKHHWKDKSLLGDIEIGLEQLIYASNDLDIESLAVPALGCGLGGLKWEEVKPLMIKYLSQLDIPVEIYEPKEVKPCEKVKNG